MSESFRALRCSGSRLRDNPPALSAASLRPSKVLFKLATRHSPGKHFLPSEGSHDCECVYSPCRKLFLGLFCPDKKRDCNTHVFVRTKTRLRGVPFCPVWR